MKNGDGKSVDKTWTQSTNQNPLKSIPSHCLVDNPPSYISTTNKQNPHLSYKPIYNSRIRVSILINNKKEMGVSSAFAGAKLETIFLSNATSIPPSSSSSPISHFHIRRTLIHKPNIKCESTPSSPDAVIVENSSSPPGPNASSLSALEQLKTSAADSNFLSSFLYMYLTLRYSYPIQPVKNLTCHVLQYQYLKLTTRVYIYIYALSCKLYECFFN